MKRRRKKNQKSKATETTRNSYLSICRHHMCYKLHVYYMGFTFIYWWIWCCLRCWCCVFFSFSLGFLRFIYFERGQCQSCASKSQQSYATESLLLAVLSSRYCARSCECGVFFCIWSIYTRMVLNFLRFMFYKLMTKW